jgi:hypothetical protein
MPDSRLPRTCHRYRIYGLVIDSELRFASIEEAGERAAGARPAVRIALKESAFFRTKLGATPVMSDGWIDHAVLGDGSFYLKAGDVFEAIVSSDGREAHCVALSDTDLSSFEANLLNFVLSAALTLQGEEPMHSTVVDIGGNAVGLLGPSGAGKSTLAASLIERGGALVTDDMLRVTFVDGKAIAHAGPQRLKLFDEPARRFLPEAIARGHFNTASGKVMLEPRSTQRVVRREWPLAALFWIGDDSAPPDGGVSAMRLAGTELAKVLLSSAMNLRYQAIDRLARQMAFAERLAASVPVHALRYPRTFAAMGRIVAEIQCAIGP